MTPYPNGSGFFVAVVIKCFHLFLPSPLPRIKHSTEHFFDDKYHNLAIRREDDSRTRNLLFVIFYLALSFSFILLVFESEHFYLRKIREIECRTSLRRWSSSFVSALKSNDSRIYHAELMRNANANTNGGHRFKVYSMRRGIRYRRE